MTAAIELLFYINNSDIKVIHVCSVGIFQCLLKLVTLLHTFPSLAASLSSLALLSSQCNIYIHFSCFQDTYNLHRGHLATSVKKKKKKKKSGCFNEENTCSIEMGGLWYVNEGVEALELASACMGQQSEATVTDVMLI